MDVCHEFEKNIAFDPPLELFYEDNDANTHDENKLEKMVEEDYSHEPHMLIEAQPLKYFFKLYIQSISYHSTCVNHQTLFFLNIYIFSLTINHTLFQYASLKGLFFSLIVTSFY